MREREETMWNLSGLLLASLVAMSSCSDKESNPAGLGSPGDQKVLASDFTIGSQADLDSLHAQMGAVSTIITGTLSITESDVTDLSALAGMSRVGGDLEISNNDSLLTLDGLQDLSTVTGFLSITSNASLTDLDSLASLRRVGTSLTIESNSTLTSVAGLGALDHIGETINISNNASLDAGAVQSLVDGLIAGGFEGDVTAEGNSE